MTIEWEIIEDPGEWHGPPLPRCETGFLNHRYLMWIEEGQVAFRLADGEVCIGDQCVESLYANGHEWIGSWDFPVRFTIEDCGNPGGWHGMARCDCDVTCVVVPDADVPSPS